MGSTPGTPPSIHPSAPTHPQPGQPQLPQEWSRYIKEPGLGRGIWGPQPLLSLVPLLQGLVQANTWVVLRDLQPGVRYHIQVRSKPDGTSMDGVWGPWSQAVAAETPHSSGEQPSHGQDTGWHGKEAPTPGAARGGGPGVHEV